MPVDHSVCCFQIMHKQAYIHDTKNVNVTNKMCIRDRYARGDENDDGNE